MLLGALIMLRVSWICFRQTPRRVDHWFRRLQLVSSAAYSMGHGGNDAQKTMGIIWLLLIANGVTTKDHLPTWVVDQLLPRDRPRHDVRRLAHREDHGPAHHEAQTGRRIRRRNRAARSRCSWRRTSASPCPPRTPSRAPSSASARRSGSSAVRWGVAGNIVIAWIVTIPASAAIAALAWWIGGLFF